jgi:hypothetical protein
MELSKQTFVKENCSVLYYKAKNDQSTTL